MKDLTVTEWTKALGSKKGKYGGGSAASVVGAFAVNLAQFVFEYQQGKKKYEENEDEIKDAIRRAEEISDALLDLAEIDADAFEPVLPLFRLPKDTEEEREIRQEKIDNGLADAAKPPLAIMKKMDDVLDLFQLLLELEIKGSIVDDIAVGLIFTEATIESEKINCDVNSKMIQDDVLRTTLEADVNEAYGRILERCRAMKATTFKIINHKS